MPRTSTSRTEAWGGGTDIGDSLRVFLQQYGDRVLSRDTLVIVASDGLDAGATGVLRDAMRELHGRAAGVMWLNPLLDSAGYEPTAAGMALPGRSSPPWPASPCLSIWPRSPPACVSGLEASHAEQIRPRPRVALPGRPQIERHGGQIVDDGPRRGRPPTGPWP